VATADPGPGDGERAFIARLRDRLPVPPDGQHWIGDDAAVLADGLLLKTDVLVEGRHFDLAWSSPADVGFKALAVNLSDIAAMGGSPVAAVVALVVDPDRPGEADGVMAGAATAAAELRCPIVGGDTSNGPALVVAVAVLGRAPAGGPVLRSGARPGDLVVVTGEVGAAAAALRALQGGQREPSGLERLRRPVPRLAEGEAAAAAGATAMIDASDGLAADLRRLCDASGCAAVLDGGSIPRPPEVELDVALFGGDDYELVFTLPPQRWPQVGSWAHVPATVIGRVEPGPPVVRLGGPNGATPLEHGGFEHRIPGPG
jgi:thiamine-monophosphate kinase